MKTIPVTPADLARSVAVVPPLARNADHSLNIGANMALITPTEQGGIRVDVIERRVDMLVSDEELAARRAAWPPPPSPF